jgi:hypothetical protein
MLAGHWMQAIRPFEQTHPVAQFLKLALAPLGDLT